MERERRTLAAEVHDGLAQYLAVARRELALPTTPRPRAADARPSTPPTGSCARACRSSRADAPAGLREAIEHGRARARAARRARLAGAARPGRRRSRSPRGSSREALANADAHAQRARASTIAYAADDERLELTVARRRRAASTPPAAPGVEDGHLGLTVMRERARGHGGDCDITSTPGTGTLVTLWIPL